jgi:hypothetical protein
MYNILWKALSSFFLTVRHVPVTVLIGGHMLRETLNLFSLFGLTTAYKIQEIPHIVFFIDSPYHILLTADATRC